MDNAVTLGAALGYALAYSATGLVLLAVGYYALDLLTPGHLGRHIIEERSTNAAIVASAGFVSLGAVLFTAIWTNSASGFGTALEWTIVFGLVGILLQCLAFLTLDLITPGSLRNLVVQKEFHPASLVAASSQIAIAGIVIASIA